MAYRHGAIFSELPMQTAGQDLNRAAIPVIRRVVDELVVGRDMRQTEHGEAIIRLNDLLRTGMQQLPVADDTTQAAGAQVFLGLMRNLIGDGGKPNRVSGPSPSCPGQ